MKESRNTKGFALIELLVILVVVAVLGVVGTVIYQRNHKHKTPNTTSNTPSHKTASAPKATDPYAGWSQYCSTQEKSCFKYPANWATKDVGAVDPTGDGIQLTSPNGTVIWFQSAVTGLGGACEPSAPDVFIHKVTALSHVSNLYVVESGTQAAVTHIGLMNGSDGQAPKTGDTGSCILATTFTSKHDPSVYSWLESNGVGNLKTSDLSTAELILESYRYQ